MKNKLVAAVIVLIFLLGILTYRAPNSAHAQAQTQTPWAFVVVGQSNAVLMCNPEVIATGTFAASYEQASLPTSIAAYYGADDSLTICAAVSGSSIASWQSNAAPPTLTPTTSGAPTLTPTAPGGPSATPRLNYYNAAVKQVRAAETAGYKVKAVIFSQGEADARSGEPSVNDWAAQAATFLDSFRTDVGEPYVPVIYTELGATPVLPSSTVFPNRYSNWEVIRKAQHELRYNRPNFFMIDKRPFDVYDDDNPPYVHNTPLSLKAIKDQIMIYLRGWVARPY